MNEERFADKIWHTLNEMEKLFSKDDLQSATREALETAVLIAHDGLNALLEMANEG